MSLTVSKPFPTFRWCVVYYDHLNSFCDGMFGTTKEICSPNQIFPYIQGNDEHLSARCIVVSCSTIKPTLSEVGDFLEEIGHYA